MPGMGMPRMMGIPAPSSKNSQNAQKTEPPSYPGQLNKNQPKRKLNPEEAEIRKQRTRKALQRIHTKNVLDSKGAGKNNLKNNILNNPKFAMLAKMMGGKMHGAPLEKKETDETQIKFVVEKPDEIIMNRPTMSKSVVKKKPKKINFDYDVVKEISEEEDSNDDSDIEKKNYEDENK